MGLDDIIIAIAVPGVLGIWIAGFVAGGWRRVASSCGAADVGRGWVVGGVVGRVVAWVCYGLGGRWGEIIAFGEVAAICCLGGWWAIAGGRVGRVFMLSSFFFGLLTFATLSRFVSCQTGHAGNCGSLGDLAGTALAAAPAAARSRPTPPAIRRRRRRMATPMTVVGWVIKVACSAGCRRRDCIGVDGITTVLWILTSTWT